MTKGVSFFDLKLANEYCERKRQEGYRVKRVKKEGIYVIYVHENTDNGDLVSGDKPGEFNRKINED